MRWSYRPYLVNGEAREVQSWVMIQFKGGVGKSAPTAGVVGMAGMSGMAGAGPGPGSRGAVRVSAGTVAGMMEQAVAPVYPPIARAAHVQGVVVLHAILSKTGEVENLQVISGPPMLVGAAEDAVRQWKYKPYLLNGLPTEVETTINVNFTFAAPPKPDAASGESTGETPTETPPDPK
jgi:protein TonB